MHTHVFVDSTMHYGILAFNEISLTIKELLGWKTCSLIYLFCKSRFSHTEYA